GLQLADGQMRPFPVAAFLRRAAPRPAYGPHVERGRIPSLNPSLIVEERIAADQEPAIFAVLTQRALLIFELYGAFEGLLALLAQPFPIIRVEEPGAKVLFLDILQGDTVV